MKARRCGACGAPTYPWPKGVVVWSRCDNGHWTDASGRPLHPAQQPEPAVAAKDDEPLCPDKHEVGK